MSRHLLEQSSLGNETPAGSLRWFIAQGLLGVRSPTWTPILTGGLNTDSSVGKQPQTSRRRRRQLGSPHTHTFPFHLILSVPRLLFPRPRLEPDGLAAASSDKVVGPLTRRPASSDLLQNGRNLQINYWSLSSSASPLSSSLSEGGKESCFVECKMKNARTSLALKSHLIAGGLAREARRDARPARDKAIKFNVKNCQNIYYFFFLLSPFLSLLCWVIFSLCCCCCCCGVALYLCWVSARMMNW